MKKTYITILRGINVSGKNMIKMPALVKTFESLGFEDVSHYLQSGNVLFNTPKNDVKDVQAQISQQIKSDFGFDVPVIVLGLEYLKTVCDNNPFAGKTDDLTKLHITFLAEEPDKANLNKIDGPAYLPDEFVVIQKAVYLYCPEGYGKTKLNNNFFESKLRVKATTRNLNTVNRLVELGASKM